MGIATGPSGLLVVDLDTPKSPADLPPEPWYGQGATCGADVLDQLAADAASPLPRTHTVTTPSGGRHLYFRPTPGLELGNTAGRLGWKIDTRGHGGYVLGAGSTIDGRYYRLHTATAAHHLPDWITARLTRTPEPIETPTPTADLRDASAYAMAALTGELDKLLVATEGCRNDRLNAVAFALGQLVGAGHLDHGTVHDELVSAAGRIGLSRSEAERTIASGLAAGARQPRRPRSQRT
ncbi:MAG TPA: bifunctional DNA primase/polymerase [Kribbella sp.]